MAASLYLAPGRASDRGDCERGCTPAIMSPDCPTHGFKVHKVRVFNERTEKFVSGEISLLEGIRLMRFLWTGQGDLPRKKRVDPTNLTLVYVESGRHASWSV